MQLNAIYWTNGQIEQTYKDLPNRICSRIENSLTVLQRKNFLREFRKEWKFRRLLIQL